MTPGLAVRLCVSASRYQLFVPLLNITNYLSNGCIFDYRPVLMFSEPAYLYWYHSKRDKSTGTELLKMLIPTGRIMIISSNNLFNTPHLASTHHYTEAV
jgi:hypothetical protein